MKHTRILLFALVACGGDSTSTEATSIVTTGATTGDTGDSPEQALCERSDECNLLMAAVSAQDCTDLENMCTDGLIMSQYTDWSAQANECLALANCQNFLVCAQTLTPCPPLGPSTCDPGCDYCYLGTETENMCPDSFNGAGDGCDCGCQFVDLDCG